MTGILWETAAHLVPYEAALQHMESTVHKIAAENHPQKIWLLEHPALYTAGTRTEGDQDLKIPEKDLPFPLHHTGRGGKITYHGPGQRVIYCLLDLKKQNLGSSPDLKAFIKTLENWMIATLRELGLTAFIKENMIGVWVKDAQNQDLKIAAIGVRVRKWITYHGMSLNINPNLDHFKSIVPCGISNYGVTSLHHMGIPVSQETVDKALMRTCPF